ncbi:MAG: hypothetical protein AVDCRST_MAG34-419 [uncultured Nocardioidaceae bacterium]|uniref:Uncharacterized protein n=1 Tax=uncultured Nocardioidaceae bacterium TaxID=253824 RepID=A0A6J4LL14_9ACTN|nr:MAG: hypothetical protein AVDCRST_MAG34-419 [uncultured Nocardioidaceae bacterium]
MTAGTKAPQRRGFPDQVALASPVRRLHAASRRPQTIPR